MIEGEQANSRMGMIAIVGILIILVSSRLLVIMETSLNEGRGPELDQEAPAAVLLLLTLMLTMAYLILAHFSDGFSHRSNVNARLVAMALAMFLMGVAIEPMLPRPAAIFRSDVAGIMLMLVPIALIAAMFLPSTTRSTPNNHNHEEE